MMNTLFTLKRLVIAVRLTLNPITPTGVVEEVNFNFEKDDGPYIYPYHKSVKQAKVRFLEGKNSREVLDFNLFLSPQDVWDNPVVVRSEEIKHPMRQDVWNAPLFLPFVLHHREINRLEKLFSMEHDLKNVPIPVVILSTPREKTTLPTER